jgi:NAD(P)-dependent dehydrogenase (short-subunit alcohol dehydrogenase family)
VNLGLGGKSAFVTGGAQGLGAAIADTLRAEDVHVLIADIDAGALKTRAHDYPEAILADLATAEGVTQATNAVIAELGGPPDILINNVGIGFNRPFAETTDSD